MNPKIVTPEMFEVADKARTEFLRDVDCNDQMGALYAAVQDAMNSAPLIGVGSPLTSQSLALFEETKEYFEETISKTASTIHQIITIGSPDGFDSKFSKFSMQSYYIYTAPKAGTSGYGPGGHPFPEQKVISVTFCDFHQSPTHFDVIFPLKWLDKDFQAEALKVYEKSQREAKRAERERIRDNADLKKKQDAAALARLIRENPEMAEKMLAEAKG
jgi:hypothetical protein